MQPSGMSKWSRSLGVVAVMGLLGAPSLSAGGERGPSLTGVWKTRTPAPFILIRPESGPTPQLTDMTWTLTEDADGLVTGVNSFVSFEADGVDASEGSLCMVGARNRSRFVLSEGREEDPETPIVVFHCEMRGRHEIRCLGSGLSTLAPLALQAVLVRLEPGRFSDHSDEEPTPDICIPVAAAAP